eukprot:3267436-Amphidinium_carterae.1
MSHIMSVALSEGAFAELQSDCGVVGCSVRQGNGPSTANLMFASLYKSTMLNPLRSDHGMLHAYTGVTA